MRLSHLQFGVINTADLCNIQHTLLWVSSCSWLGRNDLTCGCDQLETSIVLSNPRVIRYLKCREILDMRMRTRLLPRVVPSSSPRGTSSSLRKRRAYRRPGLGADKSPVRRNSWDSRIVWPAYIDTCLKIKTNSPTVARLLRTLISSVLMGLPCIFSPPSNQNREKKATRRENPS